MSKFILNEKFILDERFILFEAAMLHSDLVTKSTEIYTYAKDSKNSLDKEAGDDNKDATIEQIFEHTDKLMQDTRNVKDVSILRGHTQDYLDAIKGLLTTLGLDVSKSQDKAVKDLFDTLQAHANSSDTSNRAKKDLLDDLNKIHSVIEAFRKSLKSVKDDDNKSESKAVILIKVYEDFYKISKMTATEYNDNDKISDAVNNIYNAYKAGDLDDFLLKCKSLYDNGFRDTLNEINVSGFDRDTFETNRDADTDWAAQFKRLGDNDAFWEMCFEGIFGAKNLQKILNLGDAVKEQFKFFGFKESTNMFITFIKNYVISKAYPIDEQHYNVIHNVIANNESALKLVDLVKPQGALNASNNVIFIKEFYLKSIEDCKQYLNYQGALRSYPYENITQLDADNLPPETAAIVKKLQDSSKYPSMSEILTEVLIAGPDKLRPLAEVKEYADALDLQGGNRKAKTPWTAKNTPLLVTEIETNTVFTPKEDWAKKFVKCIAEAREITAESTIYIKGLDSKYSWYRSITVTPSDRQKIANALSSIGGIISLPMLDNIIKAFEDPSRKWLS